MAQTCITLNLSQDPDAGLQISSQSTVRRSLSEAVHESAPCGQSIPGDKHILEDENIQESHGDSSDYEDDGPATAKRQSRGTYQKYTDQQWEDLLFKVTNQFGKVSIGQACREVGIKESTGRTAIRKYMEDPDAGFLAERKPRGGARTRVRLLSSEHTVFIENFFDDAPDTSLKDLQEAIEARFGLKVSEATVRRHVKEVCHFSLQRPKPQPTAQIIGILKEDRKAWVKSWSGKEGFIQKSVFIDATRFSLIVRGFYGRSPTGKKRTEAERKVGQPPATKASRGKGVSTTVIGAICWEGVLDISPQLPAVGGNVKDTEPDRFIAFLENVMDILDSKSMKGINIVIDKANIRESDCIEVLISKRGYVPVFLPPHSPSLNPMDEIWSHLTQFFRRQELQEQETTNSRLCEAVEVVPLDTIRTCITNIYGSCTPVCLEMREL